MKFIFSSVLLLFSVEAFASSVSSCAQHEEGAIQLVMQAVASQVIGVPVLYSDFNVRIYHSTGSGDLILSISGLLSQATTPTSANGVLECNKLTGKFELAGAGTSSLN